MIATRFTSACAVSGAKSPASPNSEIDDHLVREHPPDPLERGREALGGPAQLP